MRVAVTGGTGFLGRRLIDRLVARGDQVTALIRDPARDLAPTVRSVAGDLFDERALRSLTSGCDALFHLAAEISFDPARRADLMRTNGEGTRRVLEACRATRVARAVVVSSACTLGLGLRPHQILNERHTASADEQARNGYLASKLAAERFAVQAADAMRVVIVNPTTVYGPGDATLNSGTLIKQVAESRVLPVPPGGSNVVDVDDVVDGMLLALGRGESGRRYVLGGHNLPFKDIFRTVGQVVGSHPWLVPLPRHARLPAALAAGAVGKLAGDARFVSPQLIGDLFGYKFYSSSRAQDELGYQPAHRFASSVRRAWAYYIDAGLLSPRRRRAA